MILDELKKIAEARTKGHIKIDSDCDMNLIDNTYWCEELHCNIPHTFIPTHFCEKGQQLYKNYEFIAMAANNIDKLIAVVEAAKIAVNDVELDLADVSSKLSNLHLTIRKLEDVSESNETTIIPNKIP